MIKPNELRIGNMVLLSDGTPITVSSINHEGIELFCDLDEVRDEVVSANYEFKAVEGIPLTAKWLRKLGGKKLGESDYVFGELNELHNRPLGVFISEKYGVCYRDYLTQIKYVHQLQNLYFGLTGQELEEKPSM